MSNGQFAFGSLTLLQCCEPIRKKYYHMATENDINVDLDLIYFFRSTRICFLEINIVFQRPFLSFLIFRWSLGKYNFPKNIVYLMNSTCSSWLILKFNTYQHERYVEVEKKNQKLCYDYFHTVTKLMWLLFRSF